MRQILILDDPGVNKKEFIKMFKLARLPFVLAWRKKDLKGALNVAGIIMGQTPVNEKLLNQYPALKFIAVAFTGYDKVDLAACQKRKIAVYNVPAYATDSVAELTVGLAIAFLRDIPNEDRNVRRGAWYLEKPGSDLNGKTIGIVGTGAIGLRAAELFKAFHCNLLGWSRRRKKEFIRLGGKYVKNLPLLLKQSDIVSLHLPLNKETKNFFGAKEFKIMKNSAFLINTARGGLIDQPALARALKNKTIAGAALDVFAIEPLAKNAPLTKLPNVILTPHIAFKTREALIRRAEITVENIKNYLAGEKRNRVI